MAKITFPGLNDYELMISRLSKNAADIAGRAIYTGAGIVADEIKSGIQSLPIVRGYGTAENPLPGGVTQPQKQGLLDGLGIAPLQDDGGYLNVKIGFDGYNRTKTEKYPQGQPNQMIAASTERGTIYRQKTPFIRDAVKKCRKEAEQAMALCVESEIAKKIND